MTYKEMITWLLQGDVSIQYQTYRDLLDAPEPGLQRRIEQEGWGATFLSCRHSNGHWGKGFYQPKWTSTHYTLLDLRNLNISPDNPAAKETVDLILTTEKGPDGGINPSGTIRQSDVCINGMVMNYASYFQTAEDHLTSVVDFLLSEKMPDGGFNCRSNRGGARHSSLHTTLSVAEGIGEYRKNGYRYRVEELEKAEYEAREFMLLHRLFRSDRTGAVIHPNFLKLRYPGRWYYDILKALDYLQQAGAAYDPGMDEALDFLLTKRNRHGQWTLPARHPGQVHFEMEPAGKPSRWNTLRALRVLRQYRPGTFPPLPR